MNHFGKPKNYNYFNLQNISFSYCSYYNIFFSLFLGAWSGRVEVLRVEKIFYSYPNRTLMRQKYVRYYESGREDAIHWNESGMKEVVELIAASL